MTTASTEPQNATAAPASGKYYFVLDAEDRITNVQAGVSSPFLGRVIWERLPGAEPLLREKFDEARRSGQEIEFTTFYAGRMKGIRVVPAADGLAVHVEPLTELNVRTLSTLAESLLKIEAELAARERAQPDPPALSSPQALP